MRLSSNLRSTDHAPLHLGFSADAGVPGEHAQRRHQQVPVCAHEGGDQQRPDFPRRDVQLPRRLCAGGRKLCVSSARGAVGGSAGQCRRESLWPLYWYSRHGPWLPLITLHNRKSSNAPKKPWPLSWCPRVVYLWLLFCAARGVCALRPYKLKRLICRLWRQAAGGTDHEQYFGFLDIHAGSTFSVDVRLHFFRRSARSVQLSKAFGGTSLSGGVRVSGGVRATRLAWASVCRSKSTKSFSCAHKWRQRCSEGQINKAIFACSHVRQCGIDQVSRVCFASLAHMRTREAMSAESVEVPEPAYNLLRLLCPCREPTHLRSKKKLSLENWLPGTLKYNLFQCPLVSFVRTNLGLDVVWFIRDVLRGLSEHVTMSPS